MNKFKGKSRLLAVIVIVIGIFINLFGYASMTTSTPVVTISPQSFSNQEKMASIEPLIPIALDIPRLNSSIPIINVGVTSTGQMDVPHNYVQAGWYMNGTIPGNIGSAVIDGHVDNGGFYPTIAGVFKNLFMLKVGDFMAVKMSDGSLQRFMVIDSSVYDRSKFPNELVFSQIGDSFLKLVTCHGNWSVKDKTYDQRLVVTAVKF